MKRCFIIAGGDFDGFFDEICENDLVITADKGFRFAEKENIRIDYAIGDFDSTDRPDFKNIIALNPIKDFTDTVAAIRLAMEKGYKDIVIYGGLGGRESHTISNIKTLLHYKKKGVNISLKARGKEIFVIDSDFSYKFKGHDFYVSIFALDGEAILSIDGLAYELDCYKMSLDDSLGVSNQTKGSDFKISLETGYLLIIFEDFSI
ncbi:thiamine diphosphokinase [uncultured Anaerococcus sp.]|uniref:thiamine diphosphokinase n=1 Tax=uncultured Anaerococcus sp. TaxID=293428 RepID=UPI00288B08EB|nr:thiamine diphosphokinase [uncultured Anaerococcus sp.]